jgi:hypothetical protein
MAMQQMNIYAIGSGSETGSYNLGDPTGAKLKYLYHTSAGTINVYDNDSLVCPSLRGPLRVMPENILFQSGGIYGALDK